MRRAIANAAQSAGMKAPVVNKNDMTTVHDTHASLGDAVRQRVADMQNMIESTPFKYEAGQHVFTEHGAKNNRPPMKIIRRVMVGNDPMREEQHNIMSKVIKDPATGKTKRTPYEPGYHIRQENGEQWHEYHIPEKAIIGHLAAGGQPNVDQMKRELAAKQTEDGTSTRIKIDAEGPGGVKGIVVPRHMWEGKVYKGEGGKRVEGMKNVNEARAKVYGSENRDPLTVGQIGKIHRNTLSEHFQKSHEQQLADEETALERLRAAKHIGKAANTLDESEKLDTVRHEHDEQGRTHIGFASKGVAGHSLYTSGHGENMKHHVINTCAGQTVGCGGGTDKNGVVDTSRGTCFAPNAEAQYVNAAVRRASHEQAKHDPAMTQDWILAHTGSLRNAARLADRNNQRLLFRPNVVDETDVSSRHAIRHLNEQRKAEDKPAIIANSYGKTNELHDPENGYYVTHSNVGPKVKKGQEIEENIGRDKARVRNTIMAADNKGDFTNDQGNKTPPRGSYMVTDVKRGSAMSKKMEDAITHAKYWSTGRHESELSPAEKEEGPEGHFGGTGRKTTEDKAHYGHRTHEGLRYDYQRQHVLHPRLVNVPERKKNKATGKMESVEHMIPTDSRFKDEEFLPKNRYKTKNGKEAGHILMTTPTESTSNIGHQTSFTHHVGEKHVEHALKNNGEYEIDKPEEQAKAKGKEYVAPQAVKFYAEGGTVAGRHPGLSDDDFHAFPEQNVMAQRHLAMRRGEDEDKPAARKPRSSIRFAEGGPGSQDEMLAHIMLHKADGGAVNIKDIGIDEAPDMPIKEFVPPSGGGGIPPGGVDFEPLTPGNQMMPAQPGQPPQGQAPGQPPAMGQPPQGQAPQGPLGQPRPGGPLGQPQSNILSMTPQGQALQAMRPSKMATGGAVKRNIVKIDWPT